MVTEPPDVSFGPGEASAVDSALLTCADTDQGATVGVAYAVGLRVLEGQSCDYQIAQGAFGDLDCMI